MVHGARVKLLFFPGHAVDMDDVPFYFLIFNLLAVDKSQSSSPELSNRAYILCFISIRFYILPALLKIKIMIKYR